MPQLFFLQRDAKHCKFAKLQIYVFFALMDISLTKSTLRSAVGWRLISILTTNKLERIFCGLFTLSRDRRAVVFFAWKENVLRGKAFPKTSMSPPSCWLTDCGVCRVPEANKSVVRLTWFRESLGKKKRLLSVNGDSRPAASFKKSRKLAWWINPGLFNESLADDSWPRQSCLIRVFWVGPFWTRLGLR